MIIANGKLNGEPIGKSKCKLTERTLLVLHHITKLNVNLLLELVTYKLFFNFISVLTD